MRRAVLLAALLLPALFPAPAAAPAGRWLELWQAKRVVRSHAALMRRPGFRVERARRLDRLRVLVCWSEPGYLGALASRDYGCDLISLRGREFWLRDDSIIGQPWMRWL